MPGISSYSTTPSENIQATTGVLWDEGMAPSDVNNAARQNMADIRAAFDDLIWFPYGIGSKAVAHLYGSAISTTVAGADVTAVYHAGRRVKVVGASTGTIYGTITGSSFNAGSSTTTVTYSWDGSGLVSETPLAVYLSQIPATGSPLSHAAIANWNAPRFAAYLSSSIPNVTGDGTNYMVPLDTVEFNFGSAFDASTGTFTAPAAGILSAKGKVQLNGLTNSFTEVYCSLITGTGRAYIGGADTSSIAVNNLSQMNLAVADDILLSASDTAQLNVRVRGGSKGIGVIGAISFTRFSGIFLPI